MIISAIAGSSNFERDLAISAAPVGHLLNKFAYIRYSHKRSVTFFSEKETT
jgi:hypothetical protein